ncbi:DUF4129 domain-containing protein, partial [Cognatilysobacter segetis]|uniref:DUF4129 domain-containing protein n=1 Tax=Cognatilysobacter segetis TaxID=2492394 RepID=UPI001061AD87
MRIDALTVVLRPRSSWEAVELGTALVRRHARAVWTPWLACALPAFVVANALAWWAGMPVLALLVLWWLKPVFDRIPLFVLSRAVFGEVPSTRATLRGAFRGGGAAMLGYLTWRRLGPARSLLMPIDVLEGGSAASTRARRRVLAGPAYGIASLCLMAFAAFETALAGGLAMLAFLFVPNEYLQDVATSVWQSVRDAPAWLQLLENALLWTAAGVLEPFYVGTGFGLYLGRRTEIEGWDIELAFRRLRERLLAVAGATLVLAGLLLAPRPSLAAPAAMPGRTDAAAAPAPARTAALSPADTRMLQRVFGSDYRDPARFGRAVDRAFADPQLHPRRKMDTWERREPPPPEAARASPRWIQAIASLLATLGEIGLWLLLGALVLLLAATAKHWWPWLRGIAEDVRPVPAPVVDAVPAPAAPLPDDVAAAARRLWQAG